MERERLGVVAYSNLGVVNKSEFLTELIPLVFLLFPLCIAATHNKAVLSIAFSAAASIQKSHTEPMHLP